MATAQNGWPVIPLSATATFLAPNGKLVYCHPAARDILGYLAWRWHLSIEPLPAATYNEGDSATSYRGGVRDGLVVIHAWRPGTKIAGTNVYSNHGSGMAIDVNGHLHPYEYTSPRPYRDGFTSAQRTTLRSFRPEIRALAGGADILRIGLDFASPRRDAMHLELWATRAQLDRCAAAIRSSGWIIPTARGDIAAYQRIIGVTADDHHGARTTTALRALQAAWGRPRTGRWDVDTRQAWLRRQEAARSVAHHLTTLGYSADWRGVTDYQTDHGLTPDGMAGPATITHLEEQMTHLDRITDQLAAIRTEQERQRVTLDRVDRRVHDYQAKNEKTLSALPEATTDSFLSRHVRGFPMEWWIRMGSLGKDTGHRQYPADPGSPADLLHRIAAKVLGHKIVPYDGTQTRDEQQEG